MRLTSQPAEKIATEFLLVRLRLAVMMSVTCFSVLTMPGCGGCSCNSTSDEQSQTDDDSEKESDDGEKEEEKKKPDFEIVQRPNVLPYDKDSRLRTVKPGHWIQSAQVIRTNNFDFYADLQTESFGKDQKPLGLDGSGYQLRVSRPAAFAKGEAKQVHADYFIPKLQRQENQQAWLGYKLLSRKSGREMLGDTELTTRMPRYQYYFVVLSDSPLRYGYLKKLHSIDPPRSDYDINATKPRYDVVLPDFEAGQFPLPDHALAWTSIAYLLWDEIEPERLKPEQQTALVDWLHWGGQLIIDGPGSLGPLAESFLSDYLPADKVRTVELQQSDFDQLNSCWSRATTAVVRKTARKLHLEGKPLLGIEMKKRPDADYLPGTGNLIIERQVGRGRIVVSAFSLTSRAMQNWDYRDGFFNACLLRSPSRLFRKSDGLFPADVVLPGYRDVNDPLLSSTLRFFTRDVGPAAEPVRSDEEANGLTRAAATAGQNIRDREDAVGKTEASDIWHFGGYEADLASGVCGWNDFNGASEAARTALKDAAGISTPSPKFVLSLLAVYLVVLVPVNWGFFRLIRRVEWAWIAAPLIAIIGTIVVVRSAQLDIGFVRSRTEIAVLELHGGYARGHLTRFTALYSSLSTTYDVTLEDPKGQTLPFSVRRSRSEDESISVITVRQERAKSLDGYKVRSNSTGIMHSEFMYQAEGPIRLVADSGSGWRVVNASGLELHDVGVLRRDERGQAEVAWIGDLGREETAVLRFTTPKDNRPRLPQWNNSPTAFSIAEQVRDLLIEKDQNADGRLERSELSDRPQLLEHFQRSDKRDGQADGQLEKQELSDCCRLAREGELRLGRFFDLATGQLQLGTGEVRLVGWTGQRLQGVAIRPEASQTSFRTFVLVHLRPSKPLPARPDQNHYLDVAVDDPTD